MNRILLWAGLFPPILGISLAVSAETTPPPAPPATPMVSEHSVFDPPPPSAEITRWADRCTRFTTNGWAFKAPNNFILWLDVFSAPDIWLEFARRGLDPQYYVRSLDSLLDPATAQNYLEWTDPYLYERWLGALARPEFLNAVTGILTEPERLQRWTALPLDPRPWHLLLTAMSPETWAKWLTAPFDPRTQDLLAKALDPRTAEAWQRVLSDPKNYPGVQTVMPSRS